MKVSNELHEPSTDKNDKLKLKQNIKSLSFLNFEVDKIEYEKEKKPRKANKFGHLSELIKQKRDNELKNLQIKLDKINNTSSRRSELDEKNYAIANFMNNINKPDEEQEKLKKIIHPRGVEYLNQLEIQKLKGNHSPSDIIMEYHNTSQTSDDTAKNLIINNLVELHDLEFETRKKSFKENNIITKSQSFELLSFSNKKNIFLEQSLNFQISSNNFGKKKEKIMKSDNLLIFQNNHILTILSSKNKIIEIKNVENFSIHVSKSQISSSSIIPPRIEKEKKNSGPKFINSFTNSISKDRIQIENANFNEFNIKNINLKKYEEFSSNLKAKVYAKRIPPNVFNEINHNIVEIKDSEKNSQLETENKMMKNIISNLDSKDLYNTAYYTLSLNNLNEVEKNFIENALSIKNDNINQEKYGFKFPKINLSISNLKNSISVDKKYNGNEYTVGEHKKKTLKKSSSTNLMKIKGYLTPEKNLPLLKFDDKSLILTDYTNKIHELLENQKLRKFLNYS